MVGILNVASIFLGCRPPRLFSWSASHCALGPRSRSQQCRPPLFRHLVDLTVLRICILPTVDKDILYQSDFFVGPENILHRALENILHRTLEQLTEAYCVLKHAAMNAKLDIAQSRPKVYAKSVIVFELHLLLSKLQ